MWWGAAGRCPRVCEEVKGNLEEPALYRGFCLLVILRHPPTSSAEAHTPTRGHVCSVTAVTPRILIMLRNESSLLSSGVIYFCLQLMFRALGIHGHLLLSDCTLAWFWVAHSPPSRLVLCSFHIHFGWSVPPSVSPGLSLPFFSSVVTA